MKYKPGEFPLTDHVKSSLVSDNPCSLFFALMNRVNAPLALPMVLNPDLFLGKMYIIFSL